ncbi:MAG: polysaccharide biosynthesis tyrosine autokinase [Candidatus Neomarinimicrobiota bacterium]
MEAMNGNIKQGFSEKSFQESEKEVSLQDYLRIIYRGRWIIGITFVIVMILTVYITFTTPPQYQATTILMLSGRATSTSALFQNPLLPTNYMKVNNEIQVLQSAALARSVIKALRNSPQVDSLYILGTREYHRKGIALGDLVGITISGLKSIFSSSGDEQITLIDTLDRELVKNLMGAMKVEPIRETEAIRLTITSVDPDEAALIANTIAKIYFQSDVEYNLGEVIEMKNFLEEQLVQIENDLKESEEALKEYQREEGIFGLDETAKILIDQLSTFEATYYTTLADLKITQQTLENQQQMLTEREQMVIQEAINTTNPFVNQLRNSIAEMEAEKITVMTVQGYNAEHPAIKELDKRISELKQRLFDEAEKITSLGLGPEEQTKISADLLNKILISNVEIIALDAKSKEYKKLVDQYAAKLDRLPTSTLEYARLDRERQVNEKYYILMKTKHQESRITEASKISSVRIVDPAVPPVKPIKPKKKMNMLLGLFLGLGAGLGIAFVRDYIDHSIKSGEDLQRLGLTAIAIIPTIDIKSTLQKLGKVYKEKHLDDEILMKARLVSHYDPKSAVAEAYRTLRTNIQFMSPDRPVKSLLVTSAGPGDGKSTTVINIAITFASLGKKTLLIDADLRKPVLHKIFEFQRGPGLTHMLIESLQDEDIIRHTEVPDLDLITCGDIPPNPSELLASQRLKNFVERMKEKYEIILFDTPPIIAVTDATVLSQLTDGLILVVRAGSTDLIVLERSLELMRHVKANLIGAVLNGVNISTGYDSYYYYYRYYSYYSDAGIKKKSSRAKRRHHKA